MTPEDLSKYTDGELYEGFCDALHLRDEAESVRRMEEIGTELGRRRDPFFATDEGRGFYAAAKQFAQSAHWKKGDGR